MKKELKKRITMGMALMILALSIFFSTNVFAANEGANTTTEIGVAYRGHVQNEGDMPAGVSNFITGPEALGTRGRSLRVEGFMIKLTGNVPEGANIVYQVHVQNEGWMTAVSNGDFAGTRGKSQRVESIKISLENMPGYDVYYHGHVQNIGNIPQVDGEWGWVKNGEELGTTGSSLRLEELEVKIIKRADITYDKAGTYGPKTDVKVIDDNVTINKTGVVLQNMHIKGDLTIGEGVGEGDVTLNNITVDGQTYVRGGGKNSIHINGGQYNNIVVQQTSSGQVRIVATDVAGMEVVISENAKGEAIILEGSFDNVKIEAPDVKISTQGETTIKDMVVAERATGSEITLDTKTTVNNIELNAGVDMKGEGTIEKANVNSDNVTFEQAPVKETVAPEVTVPPVVAPPTPTPEPKPEPTPTPSPGGGGPSAEEIMVAEYTNAASSEAFVALLDKNALGLDLTGYAALDAIGKNLVGTVMLNVNTFANKAEVQSTVEWAIENAKVDAEARAYMASLMVYAPELEGSENTMTITYPNKLTAEQKTILKGLYGDMVISINDPLTDGESLEVTVNGKTKTVTKADFSGNEILLSKLMGLTLGDNDLVVNQKTTSTISIKEIRLKDRHYFTVTPCTTRNGVEYFKMIPKGASLFIAPSWLNAYTKSMVVSANDDKFTVQYDGNLTEADKTGLDGYYADAMIYLGRPLQAGEEVTVNAFGKQILVTKETVTEENGSQIKLSTLLGINLGEANLAVNQSGSFEISIIEKNLFSELSVSANAILVKGENAPIFIDRSANIYVKPAFLEAYIKSITVNSGESNFKVVYAGNLSETDKVGLTGYYSDALIRLSRSLEIGEEVTVTAFGKVLKIDRSKISEGEGTEIRLSKLLGLTLGEENLAANQSGSFEVEISNPILKSSVSVYASPIITKDDGNAIFIDKTTNLTIEPTWLKAYTKSMTVNYTKSKFAITYAGNLTESEKSGLAGYYADAIVYLQRPLEDGESISVVALGKEITITSGTILDGPDQKQIRLSKLMGITLGPNNLASNQQGAKEIILKDINIREANYMSIDPILVNSNGEENGLGKWISGNIYPTWMDAYMNTVDITNLNSNIVVSYEGNLSPSVKDSLGDYNADVMINLSRELEDGEEISVAALGKTTTLTKDKMDGSQIKLSDLIGITQLAGTKSGDDVITCTEEVLGRNVTIYAQPILVKNDEGIWLDKGTAVSLYQPSFKAYANTIDLGMEGNKFLVKYSGILSPMDREKLTGYYSDAVIYLDRALAQGETVTVKAFEKNVVISCNTPSEDVEKQRYRLSTLLGITLGEENLAVNQSGSFEISVEDNKLNKQMNISAQAVLIKGSEIEYLDKMTGMSINPPSFDAYADTVEIQPYNDYINVLYKGGITTENTAGLAGCYADTKITFDRELEDNESVTVSAYEKTAEITGSYVKQRNNEVSLLDVLDIELDDNQLATQKTGNVEIRVIASNLLKPTSICAWKALVKGDGTWVYRANNGCGFLVNPIGIDPYVNSLSIMTQNNQFLVNYNGIDESQTADLAGYYSDAMVYLGRSLDTDEEVIVNAFGEDHTINANMITEQDGKKIRLSTVLGITLGEDQLAAKQKGSFVITIIPKHLNAVLEVYAQAILVRQDGDIMELNRGATAMIPTVINQSAPTEILTGIAPTTLNTSGGKITGTTTAMEYKKLGEVNWNKVLGTEITDLSSGTYEIRYAGSDGINAGELVEVVVPASFEAAASAYTPSVEIVGNMVTVTYPKTLDPDDKAALSDYYADTQITLGRVLTEEESVMVTPSYLEGSVPINSSTQFTDKKSTLSYLLTGLASTITAVSQISETDTAISYTLMLEPTKLKDNLTVEFQTALVRDGVVSTTGDKKQMILEKTQ